MKGPLPKILSFVEKAGNRLPDPALLFVILMLLVWAISWPLSAGTYDLVDPRTGVPIEVQNLLSAIAITDFFSNMVSTFIKFHPLGVVLVAMLGIAVADHLGFIRAALRALLSVTAKKMLTPMLILIAIMSHSAADAGYVLVIPLGGIIFSAAGRHPLAGIAAAFAGVSGGFSANFLPSALDPMLQGISQASAQLLDPEITLNPLNNWFFTASSTLLIIFLGWYVTDKIVEPHLQKGNVANLKAEPTKLEKLDVSEAKGLRAALIAVLIAALIFAFTVLPLDSPWRNNGELTSSAAPLMRSIVPLIFMFFILPGVVYGYASGQVSSHRQVVDAMTKGMSSMAYYIVIAFFASLFIAEFGRSNLGILLALYGADWLEALAMPGAFNVIGVILITCMVNLFVGSASAKWALLGPVLIPMLMTLGISPDLTQAAYRVGDSSTNIITPLMPYFPLVVVFCQRHMTSTGIGTVISMMLPYALVFLFFWTAFLLLYWGLDIPRGLQANYTY